jgi:tRNA(fMet)-specific endonuclease VapC
MQRVILDTDILSEILKGKSTSVIKEAQNYAALHGRFTFTAISVHEILYGLHYKNAPTQLKQASACFEGNEIILPILDDYETAGRIRGAARQQGQQLTSDDCLIGAIAARLALPLVTGNTHHFTAIQRTGLNLQLENWRMA